MRTELPRDRRLDDARQRSALDDQSLRQIELASTVEIPLTECARGGDEELERQTLKRRTVRDDVNVAAGRETASDNLASKLRTRLTLPGCEMRFREGQRHRKSRGRNDRGRFREALRRSLTSTKCPTRHHDLRHAQELDELAPGAASRDLPAGRQRTIFIADARRIRCLSVPSIGNDEIGKSHERHSSLPFCAPSC